jgi:alginate O-acetyltransferase complex protein AlgI
MVEVVRAVFERRHPPPTLASLVNYLLPFHMLTAGPIQAYEDYVRQSTVFRTPAALDVLVAVERMAKGLFKKFVLAFALQRVFLTDFQAGGAYFLLELQVFFVWLYLDFSAYTDIAVGIGSLMGVATPENFNRPFIARNVIEFWERWHISLSLFVRRNVFSPLQVWLLRRNRGRHALWCAVGALGISFVLVGVWHGLTRGYLMWGTAQAAGLMTVRLYDHALLKRLGKEGIKTYLANPWIRMTAVALTFEFEALTLVANFMK